MILRFPLDNRERANEVSKSEWEWECSREERSVESKGIEKKLLSNRNVFFAIETWPNFKWKIHLFVLALSLSLCLHLSVRTGWPSPNEVKFILTYSMKSIINLDAVVNVIQLIVHKEIVQAKQMVYATIICRQLRNLCIHFQLTFQHNTVLLWNVRTNYIMCVISTCLRANFFDWKRLRRICFSFNIYGKLPQKFECNRIVMKEFYCGLCFFLFIAVFIIDLYVLAFATPKKFKLLIFQNHLKVPASCVDSRNKCWCKCQWQWKWIRWVNGTRVIVVIVMVLTFASFKPLVVWWCLLLLYRHHIRCVVIRTLTNWSWKCIVWWKSD